MGSAQILPNQKVTLAIKEGFRITTQLLYDRISETFESKTVKLISNHI